ncbi:MAG: response regulator transcription factor [Bacteroidales bacterium]|nr:response regulator transcription factor [Bacteroidales bacterium]
MAQIKVMVADDHKMFREGIKALLEKEKNITVVSEANDGEEVFMKLSEKPVDLILLDISMEGMNGIEIAKKVCDQFPDVKILALSMHSEINYITSMLEAGATGYILKNTGKEEMITAIKTVASGDSYFSNEVSVKLIQNLNKKSLQPGLKDTKEIPLTKREIEILQLIVQEYSNPEIAKKLFISIRTVDTHRRNLLEKLGVKNTAGLVKYAIKHGLI